MQNHKAENELGTPPKSDAGINPYYLLATLYGEPKPHDEVTKARNRRAWNRYYACLLAEAERQALILRGVSLEDLTPFSQEEENNLAAAFAARRAHSLSISLPAADAPVDFQNISFENDVGFEGYIFSTAIFSGAQFVSSVSFKKAAFLKESHFERADFAGGALFEKAVFEGPAQFQAASFGQKASWEKAVFNGTAHFDDVAFTGSSHFEEAHFALWAAFRNTRFAATHFGSAQFAGGTTFEAAVFTGAAHFSHACFEDWLSFQDANFHSSSFFLNVEMKNKTIFDEASFLTQAPVFSGAKLHQGTEWEKIKWPKPKGRDKAKKILLSHERLKQQVNRLEQRAAALESLGKEMQGRPILQGRMLGLPAAIFSLVSNYRRLPL